MGHGKSGPDKSGDYCIWANRAINLGELSDHFGRFDKKIRVGRSPKVIDQIPPMSANIVRPKCFVKGAVTDICDGNFDLKYLLSLYGWALRARLYIYRNNGSNRCIDAHKYLNIWHNNRQCLYFEVNGSAAFYIWYMQRHRTVDLKYLLSLYTLKIFL